MFSNCGPFHKGTVFVSHRTHGSLRSRHRLDTTVQPKNVTHPTDAKPMHKTIVMLAALSRKHGVKLRQSYVRLANPRHGSWVVGLES